MMRWINLGLIALVVAVATWTYQVKHDAEAKLNEIRALEKKIALERETIELLKADWAFLSQPSRLQALIERYGEELGLQVTGADQIIQPDELPERPILELGDGIGDIIAGDAKDDMTTSAISEGQGN